MADLNNHMDKVFREKLGNYRKDPPDEVWAAIKSETDKRRARKLIFITWRVAAGIAIIITAGYTYYYFSHTEQPLTENLENQQEIVIEEAVESPVLAEKNDIPLRKSEEAIPDVNKADYADKKGVNNQTKESVGLSEPEMEEQKTFVAALSLPETVEQNSELNIDLIDLPDILNPGGSPPDRIPYVRGSAAEIVKRLNLPFDLNEETTVKKDIWSISAQVSPTYNYRSLSQGDPGSIASLNETESGKFSYGGGLQLGIKATERLSFFTGLMYSRIGIEIRNVQSYQTVIQDSYTKVRIEKVQNSTNLYSFSNSTGFISSQKPNSEAYADLGPAFFGNTSYASALNNSQVNRLDNAGIVNNSDKIDQYFQFIELPFLLRFKVLNRKLKMNLLGGVSTNVLIGNRVLLVTDNSKSIVGETQGLRTINYSGNLGFGFDYDLGKNFLFSIEPQFKYYLNSINESRIISSRPYSLGMFTGLRYIF